MSWSLLKLVRNAAFSDSQYGTLYIMSAGGSWTKLSYAYELPWLTDNQAKSLNNQSRLVIGSYEMQVRTDGPKGWRLELQHTGHRNHIQVHRAHHSMFIQGCILPVPYIGFPLEANNQPKHITSFFSILLMNQIKMRYDELRSGRAGNPTIQITAIVPSFQTA